MISTLLVKNECTDSADVDCKIESQTLTNFNIHQSAEEKPMFLWQAKRAKVKIITLLLLAYPMLISLLISWMLGIEVYHILLICLAIFQLSRYAMLSLLISAFLCSILLAVLFIRYLTDRKKRFAIASLKGNIFSLIVLFLPVGFWVIWDMASSNHAPPFLFEVKTILFYTLASSIFCSFVIAMVSLGLSITKESEDDYALRAYGLKIKSITGKEVEPQNGIINVNFLGKNQFKVIK